MGRDRTLGRCQTPRAQLAGADERVEALLRLMGLWPEKDRREHGPEPWWCDGNGLPHEMDEGGEVFDWHPMLRRFMRAS